jgi:regulator of nucleoside diphosphate kinase
VPTCFYCRSTIESGLICRRCADHAAAPVGSDEPKVILTVAGFNALEDLAQKGDRLHSTVRAAIRRKLVRARVVLPEDVPERTITFGSRVTYRLNAGAHETRTLAAEEAAYTPHHNLLVTMPAGIALLGIAEGDREWLPGCAGPARQIHVVSVVYQPEHAHKSFLADAPSQSRMNRTPGAVLSLLPRRHVRRDRPEGDNPGPAAA